MNDLSEPLVLASRVLRCTCGRPCLLDHHDVLGFATTAGAAAWGMSDRIGSLTPGKRADLILVDTRRPHLSPLNDAVTTVVLNAGPADVDTVLVDGRILKRHGKLTGQAAHAQERLEESRRRLFAAAGLNDILGPAWV
ncbi:amidohydrolase family protein [Actinacidiphila glaucinigra]|uniref:amidohydrolase family protein n=1 Tax=Actinacidiphila glaucinigra TaxID=235986 RepID=UPI00324B5B86